MPMRSSPPIRAPSRPSPTAGAPGSDSASSMTPRATANEPAPRRGRLSGWRAAAEPFRWPKLCSARHKELPASCSRRAVLRGCLRERRLDRDLDAGERLRDGAARLRTVRDLLELLLGDARDRRRDVEVAAEIGRAHV